MQIVQAFNAHSFVIRSMEGFGWVMKALFKYY